MAMIGGFEQFRELPIRLVHPCLVSVDVLGYSCEHPVLIGDLLVKVLRLHLCPLYYTVNLVQLRVLVLKQHLLLLKYSLVIELSRHVIFSVFSPFLLQKRLVVGDLIRVNSRGEHNSGGFVGKSHLHIED